MSDTRRRARESVLPRHSTKGRPWRSEAYNRDRPRSCSWTARKETRVHFQRGTCCVTTRYDQRALGQTNQRITGETLPTECGRAFQNSRQENLVPASIKRKQHISKHARCFHGKDRGPLLFDELVHLPFRHLTNTTVHTVRPVRDKRTGKRTADGTVHVTPHLPTVSNPVRAAMCTPTG